MTRNQLMNPKFSEMITSLAEKEFSPEVALKLADIIEKVVEEQAIFQEKHEAALNEFSEKDESGNRKLTEDGSKVILTDELAFGKRMKVIREEEVDLPTIDLQDLGNAPVKPQEMVLLKHIIKR